MIRRILGKIFLYSFLVFFVVQYGPDFGFNPLKVITADGISDYLVYIILGFIFWVIYDLVRKALRIAAKPLSWISFGIVGIIINIVTIYGFAYIVTFVLDAGIIIEMGAPLEITLFSIIVRCVDLLF